MEVLFIVIVSGGIQNVDPWRVNLGAAMSGGCIDDAGVGGGAPKLDWNTPPKDRSAALDTDPNDDRVE